MRLFADHSADVIPQPYNFYGQTGWFSVPLGWKVRTNDNGTMTASPNEDFSRPTYDAVLNVDGTLVFQSLMGAFAPDVPNLDTNTIPATIQSNPNNPVIPNTIILRDVATGKKVTIQINDGQMEITESP